MFRFIFFFLVLVGVFGASFYYLFFGKSMTADTAQASTSRNERIAMADDSDPAASPAPAQQGPLWVKRCDETEHCEVFQMLQVVKTGQRLVEFAVGSPDQESKAKAVVILPHGLLLPEGLSIKVGDQLFAKTEIRTCTEGGCVAVLDLTTEQLNTLKNGKDMTLIVKEAQGKTINVIMSLEGFSEAYSAL